jgi:hypothetical protein
MNLFEMIAPVKKTVVLEGIDHPEDLIIKDGAAGAERVARELAGLSKNTETVTIKWDGFPAVVFGRDKSGALVFMDKHMYEKVANGKMDFMTIRSYDEGRGANRTSLWEHEAVLRPVLEKIVPGIKDQYFMGDLMWTGTPSTKDGFFVFKPNTVEYRVEIAGELGDRISKSVGGIAVHTIISGLGSADKPLVGLKGLPENGGITFLVGEIKNKPKVSVNKDLLAQTNTIIQQNKSAVEKFMTDLTAIKGKAVLTAMGPFITSMLEEDDVQTDIVPRFMEFLKNRLTDSMAVKMLGTKQDGWLYQQDGGAPGLLGVWSMWAAVTELKLHIKRQIDTQLQGSEVVAITDGNTAHEGYVFGGGKDKLKLIDRLGFSKANFAKHRVPDEEVAAKSKMPMAAFCFGRMNPPTIGHKLVMEKTVATGGTNSYIFLSNSNKAPDDPLDPATKAEFIKKIYPQFAKNIVTDYVQGPIYAANWLYDKGFRHMTFIGGSDRLGKGAGSIEKLLNGWNSGPVRTTDNARGANGREHVVLKFVSSGERDGDTNNVSGISGSLARKYATEGNQQGFESATGVKSNIQVNGKSLYQATREGLGIQEPAAEPAPQQQPTAVAQPAVAEALMPASNFTGSKKNKLGKAGQWRNKGPKANKPAKAGDLVGGM